MCRENKTTKRHTDQYTTSGRKQKKEGGEGGGGGGARSWENEMSLPYITVFLLSYFTNSGNLSEVVFMVDIIILLQISSLFRKGGRVRYSFNFNNKRRHVTSRHVTVETVRERERERERARECERERCVR